MTNNTLILGIGCMIVGGLGLYGYIVFHFIAKFW